MKPIGEATWRSGDAADCKSVHPGSIPGVASNSATRADRPSSDTPPCPGDPSGLGARRGLSGPVLLPQDTGGGAPERLTGRCPEPAVR